MPTHCFAYGSLMCNDIMAAVCGVPVGTLTACAARLPGFARHPVLGEAYPGMVPALGEVVDGVVYLDLPPSAWPRLDVFEGEMYDRQPVPIELSSGETIVADTYVFRPDFAHRLGPGEWDFAIFLREGKAGFTDHYLGFGRI